MGCALVIERGDNDLHVGRDGRTVRLRVPRGRVTEIRVGVRLDEGMFDSMALASAEWTGGHEAEALADAAAAVIERLRQIVVVTLWINLFLFVAEVFTGAKGKYVSLKDTIASFKGILAGEYDHLPEQAFYMVGTIEEALEKGKGMDKAA